MIVGRQLGEAAILAFALLYRDVRVLQFVFAMAFIREAIDLWEVLSSGSGTSPALIVGVLIIELAAFIHLGAVESRLRKASAYLPGGPREPLGIDRFMNHDLLAAQA